MRYLTLPRDFQPESGWSYDGLEALVDCEAYTRHGTGLADDRWCELAYVSPGSASVYPVKVEIPERGIGQFKFDEVKGWRYLRAVLEALEEVDRAHGRAPEVLREVQPTAIPPGIDPVWLRGALQ